MPQKAQHGVDQAVQKGRARAHGHQAVHGRGLVQQGRRALNVKMPPQPDHWQGQQQLHQHKGARRTVRLQPGWQGETHHVPHGHDQQGHGKAEHGPETAQALPPVLQGLGLGRFILGRGVLVLARRGRKAQLGDALHDLPAHLVLVAGLGPDLGLGRGQVHTDLVHPVQLAHHALDARGAGGAMHAADIKAQLAGFITVFGFFFRTHCRASACFSSGFSVA